MKDKSIDEMKRRYARLTTQLGKIGLVLQGTITKRIISRQNPNDRRKLKNYGPYYQWTRKIRGKTVTVNLTASQAKVYQKAINDQRKMEKITREMRNLSMEILQAETKGVKKRKPKL